jgi:hypothetical protein
MRRLPPLNALRVFEVAARTGSYAEAGVKLGLTHGAVSRPGGSVNRLTSSSRRSLGSTTSKVDPGRDYIDTR